MLVALERHIDPAWMAAARGAEAQELLEARAVGGVDHMLQRRLGWAAAEGGGVGCPVLELTVKAGTELQLGPERQAKEASWRKFYAAASGRPPSTPGACEEVQAWLGRVWDGGWENKRKEQVFKLVYDGFATKARMHMLGALCACGVVCPGREHAFWDCPVAAAVVGAIRAQLPPCVSLGREHVWLGKGPACDLDGGIWDVVAVAAIGAMAEGRALLVRWELAPEPPAAGAGPPADSRVAVASRQAVMSFWAGLQEFASLQRWPRGWAVSLPARSRFLRPQGNTLVVVGP
jgi:hypothetical protein